METNNNGGGSGGAGVRPTEVIIKSAQPGLTAMQNVTTEVPVEWEQEFNPAINEKAISIIEQSDGNWKGFAKNRGKLISVRAGDPATVLTQLITHS